MSTSVTIVDIQGAARSLEGLAIQSPLLRCDALAERARAVGLREIWLKCENLQPGGSFKIRGAAHALVSLPPEQARRGVVTHSSGNFALALARAAARLGLDCTVIMPEGASAVKVEGVQRAGARLLRCAPTQAAREEAAREVVEQRGAVLIHPSDDPRVIAGQGTVGLELALEAPWLDATVVPVGGGGLAGGVAVALRSMAPAMRVLGAEPRLADDAIRSRASGRRLPPQPPLTLAEGLRTGLGEHTWPLIRDLMDDVLPVEEEELMPAVRLLLEEAHLVVEPSGAIGLALALSGRLPPGLERVAVVLSGGNIERRLLLQA